MAAFDLTATMDGVATLITNSGLVTNVYAYPVESVTVPCAVVGYPKAIDFDMTFGRGGDSCTLPVYFVVGRTMTKDARDRLSTILADATSIKSALDGSQSFGSVRVMNAQITDISFGDISYLSAEFTIDIKS